MPWQRGFLCKQIWHPLCYTWTLPCRWTREQSAQNWWWHHSNCKKHKCKEQVLYYSSHPLSIGYRTELVLDSITKTEETHHQLIPSKQKKQVECMEKIKSIIERHKNPFAMKEDPSLCNIITDNVPSEWQSGEKSVSWFCGKKNLQKQSLGLWVKINQNMPASSANPNWNSKRIMQCVEETDLNRERLLAGQFLAVLRL